MPLERPDFELRSDLGPVWPGSRALLMKAMNWPSALIRAPAARLSAAVDGSPAAGVLPVG